MLTTCPKCSHTFSHHQQSQQCCTQPMATIAHQYVNLPPKSARNYVNQSPPPSPPRQYVNQRMGISQQFLTPPPRTSPPPPKQQPQNFFGNNMAVTQQQWGNPHGGISVSLHLPPTGSTTVAITTSNDVTPSVTLTAYTNQDTTHRVLAGMAGGGIVSNNNIPSGNVILQNANDFSKCPPQPSPSTPLSFVLPSPHPLAASTPFPGQPWSQTWSVAPQSDTDLVRLAATLSALRTSGWYYEGLSWQESADLLRPTLPGTFLVRDSSDPRFLFSLSVQTDRGPMSVRLHYVCGQFRFDADSRLAPRMPLFDCVVKLVEHYIAATRDSGYSYLNITSKKKDQVWVDASGQMYSHILLTTPLYKKSQLPTLQHLARLVINDSIAKRTTQNVSQLPLPETLKTYLKEYPYSH